ncbi:SMAD/FHA domain superfamily [Sesbania bispinosa]|nr:SMAD/FHA domain superfamily [Sesbania bispinosa]
MPPPNPQPQLPPPHDSTNTDNSSQTPKSSQGITVPYKIPPSSATPCHEFYLEVLKDGSIIDKLNVCEKGAYMFGRLDLYDFVLEHPTISRFHAKVSVQSENKVNSDCFAENETHGSYTRECSPG